MAVIRAGCRRCNYWGMGTPARNLKQGPDQAVPLPPSYSEFILDQIKAGVVLYTEMDQPTAIRVYVHSEFIVFGFSGIGSARTWQLYDACLMLPKSNHKLNNATLNFEARCTLHRYGLNSDRHTDSEVVSR